VPACTLISFSVNRGPSSCKRACTLVLAASSASSSSSPFFFFFFPSPGPSA